MDERQLGRRQALRGVGVAMGGVALTAAGASRSASAHDEDHDDDDHGGRLDGSWMVTRQDDPPGEPTMVTTIISFAAGNVLVVHDISPADAPLTGTWARREHRGFEATVWTGFPGGPNGGPGPTLRVVLRGGGQQRMLSGSYEFTVFAPGSDTVIAAGTGTFSGSRIPA